MVCFDYNYTNRSCEQVIFGGGIFGLYATKRFLRPAVKCKTSSVILYVRNIFERDRVRYITIFVLLSFLQHNARYTITAKTS